MLGVKFLKEIFIMNALIKKWLDKNTASLKSKCVAITGATGGLGRELCLYLAYLGADLVLINRNEQKALALKNDILKNYPDTKIQLLTADLESMDETERVCQFLEQTGVDIIIHNAGAYAIERRTSNTGFLNVFQINFVSPMYMTTRLLPMISARKGRVVVVSSIAHNYSKIDSEDIDFSKKTSSALCYGNSKRYLMFAHEQLFKNENLATLSITHPGITFTGITDHYPDWLFKIIKNPMKIIFMKPKVAALCIIKGVFEKTQEDEWFAPRFFGIWGTPLKRRIRTANVKEKQQIFLKSCEIYNTLSVKNGNTKV